MTAVLMVALVFCGGTFPQQDNYQVAKAIFDADARPITALRSYTQENPTDPWGYHFLGKAEQVARRLASAEAALRRAIELDPRQSWHHAALGELFLKRSDQENAAAAFARAAELEPNSDQRNLMLKQSQQARDIVERLAASRQRMWLVILASLCVGGAVLFRLRR